MSRESDDQFLRCDFPLRRQCTCRKLPVQTAQLMRVHVVTPKAPITVTIQPAVEVIFSMLNSSWRSFSATCFSYPVRRVILAQERHRCSSRGPGLFHSCLFRRRTTSRGLFLRYYILQLPFIYSGPSGVWIPPVGLDRVGTFKGNAIQVKYVPMLSRK